MKRLPAPDILIRQWLHNPHAITVAAFVIAGIFLWIAGWLIHRNLRHNVPGLRTPFALAISAAGVFGAWRLPSPYALITGGVICGLASLLFYFADHRRWVRDPAGKIVADRWQIVLAFAGSGTTSGTNGLLAAH
jgi:glucose dehydrogenase